MNDTEQRTYITTKRAPTLGEMRKSGVLCVPQRDIGEFQNSNAIEQGNICWLRIQENLKCRSRILQIIGNKNGKTIQKSLCEWGTSLPDKTSPIIQRKNNGGFILGKL